MTKYLDKDGLVLYDQKIKAIIKKAQTAADNAQSSANTANTAAAQAKNAAQAASIAAQAAQTTADKALPKSGGNMTGAVNWTGTSSLTEGTTIDKSGVTTPKFVRKNGKSTQILMADGTVKTVTASGGMAQAGMIPMLDSTGRIPLAQLGNVDTTLFEVVKSLPTSNIKSHIYLVESAADEEQNRYSEYIYTGDVSATYDETKWEKLGDMDYQIDLADYPTNADAVGSVEFKTNNGSLGLGVNKCDGRGFTYTIPTATTSQDGVMTKLQVSKLNGIEAGANKYVLPHATTSVWGGVKTGTTVTLIEDHLEINDDEVKIPITEIEALFK